MGKFIVIDGLDGSGKGTQSAILAENLKKEGKKAVLIDFPMYASDSSLFVRKYLGGELGSRPEDTNAYAASSFFAMDRYVSYRQDWGRAIEDENTVVIANRYTSANAVHQLSKLPREEWDAFLSWLWDFEFDKIGIPAPDTVIYLEMTPDISMRLVNSRSEATGRKKDIHELDASHLEKSYAAALYASETLGWKRIKCYENGEPLTVEEISRLVREAAGV